MVTVDKIYSSWYEGENPKTIFKRVKVTISSSASTITASDLGFHRITDVQMLINDAGEGIPYAVDPRERSDQDDAIKRRNRGSNPGTTDSLTSFPVDSYYLAVKGH